ncbi:MAG: hypothetical protein JWQ02_1665, partial [Capsulimonas sp.]|nr:hypothetical protein [Capsulimonas sp.]
RKKVVPVTISFATLNSNSTESPCNIPLDGQMSSEDTDATIFTSRELAAAPNTSITVTIKQGGKVIVTKKYVL